MTNIPENFASSPELLRDRVVLVTGATGGFGKSISLGLARHGATVILLARNLRLVESLYDEIEQAGYPTPAIYPMNLEGATENDYLDLAKNIETQLGRLDGLIHNAAILGTPTPFSQSDSETWYKVHQVNLHAPYMMTRACLPLLTQSDRSSLLFMIDDKSGAYWDAYQVSKKALEAMAGLLANEYQDTNLCVNCFDPGKTRTAIQLGAFPAADENDELPLPDDHLNNFLYLMSTQLTENGAVFRPES
jgi:NAD(P)-dependent dehydrogenase (short-subunit alcohol dehydrogenase family)